MSRYAPACSATELKSFITKKLEDAGVDMDDWMYQELHALFDEDVDHPPLYPILKDWGKINFDIENHIPDARPGTLYNYQTLPNGFSFVGYMLGGDWEVPVFGIVYSDGSKLRGYIPTKGNVFDAVNKRAWGNNDDDEDECYNHQEDQYDWEAIKQDIMDRIQIR